MNKKEATLKDIDDLSHAEIDDRVEQTLAHLSAIETLWPGLARLDEAQRRTSSGRALSALGGPLGKLFDVLAPPGQSTPPPIAKPFDVLGTHDDGQDPERFEADLLARRLYRAQAEQKVADAFNALARHFADDVLATGERVIGPGLLALELARSLAKAKPEYGTLLAPVLDAFRAMTKRARRARFAGQTAGGAPPTPVPPAPAATMAEAKAASI
ncbi:MAG TPA: hypothetical protein VHB21_09720 [Minicystis sp.]|nr:hypothetical protein [Minicystis sp.]